MPSVWALAQRPVTSIAVLPEQAAPPALAWLRIAGAPKAV
jgi:hypothetical protein